MLTIQCVKLNWKSALVWQGPVLDKLDNDTLSLISDTKQSIPINRSAASINGLVRAQSSAQQIELSPLLLGRYDMPGVPCLQSAWIPNNPKIPKNGSSPSIAVQVLTNITCLQICFRPANAQWADLKYVNHLEEFVLAWVKTICRFGDSLYFGRIK